MNIHDYLPKLACHSNAHDYYEPVNRKSKIGHLGLLAELCLKYSYEFNNIIIEASTVNNVRYSPECSTSLDYFKHNVDNGSHRKISVNKVKTAC